MRCVLIFGPALAACLVSAVCSASGKVFDVGVFPNNGAEFRRIVSVAKEDPGVTIANLRDAKHAGQPMGAYNVILATARFMKEAEAEALRRYATEGGLLVVMGRSGEYEDNDGDGKKSPGDRRAWALSKLCGVSRAGSQGGFRFLRVWGHHPFFMGLPVAEPVALAEPGRLGALTRCEGAAPLATGFFRPTARRLGDGRDAREWYAASRACGESVYMTVKRAGKGTAVYIADDLVGNRATPVRKMVLRRVLSRLSLALGPGQPPPEPILGADDGNLVYNGDMEDVCVVTNEYSGNAAKAPFDFPLGWRYNTWGGGKYRIAAVREKGGNWFCSGVYCGEAGVAANSACVLRYHHFSHRPRPGGSYTLSFRVRSDRAVRVGLWGKTVSGKPWKVSVARLEKRDWRRYSLSVRIPPNAFGAEESQFGFYLDFAISGAGRIDLDDVMLGERRGE